MKAAQITTYGDAEVLITVNDASKPDIAADQVLVEVYAAGLNPFDWKVRGGHVRAMAELTFPATLGGDLAGVVAQVGTKVTHVKPGDAVYGLAGALSGKGSLADFAPVSGSQIAPKPESLDFTQAAALPLVGVSAYQALVEILKIKPGQKVLITGGSGGIGSVAIQLAKHIGAYVATTASSAQINYVKSLGADEVFDYKTEKFADKLTNYDAVFDTVGGETNTAAYAVLKVGGAIVSMAASPDDELAKSRNITASGMYTGATTERLLKLTELIESGVITINIDKTFPLEQVGEALDYLETGHPRGKVVVIIKT
jgi:alcohol dehydrogenase